MEYLHNIGALANDELTYSANMVAVIVAAKVAAERERCAKVCEDSNTFDYQDPGGFFAALIRGPAA